ncbi:MAG: metal-dependent hydrolase [Dehalococcoidales bacterium]
MLFFGHAGITLGAAAMAAGALDRRQPGEPHKISWFAPLARYIDIRLLLIGSLLPDIIDKPIGQYFFRTNFYNGRIYAHTLLFLLVLAGAGYYLYRSRRQVWLMTLAAGTFTHLALDEMWQVPGTLFWPLVGFSFPRYELADYLGNLLKEIISNPYIYVSEIIGLAIIVWFGVWLLSRRKFGSFIRRGKIY